MAQLDSITVPADVLALIPKSTAVDFVVLPLLVADQTVVVAASEDHGESLVSDLEFLLGRRVKIETYPLEPLAAAIQRHYKIPAVEARRTGATASTEGPGGTEQHSASRSPLGSELQTGAQIDHSIVSLVNRIITEAIDMGASDIHVEPYERVFRIRYRLDGVLHEVHQPPIEKAKSLISRLKIMADLDIAEKRRPQDGRIRVKQGSQVIDIRVSTLPTDFGEKVVLRILDKSRLQLDLGKLGFEESDLRIFKRTIGLPYGMILVTGPTGCGKTTTLYAALNSINRPEINITTIEDPIEYNLHGINQTHVRSDIGLSFAAALRSILRQDPNVIMVGEIRDSETAEIAVRAALTGHLVFSTLHTNDAPSAVTRLIEMGIEPFLVASSLKMILAQRLLRTLCPRCKVTGEPTADQRAELDLDSSKGSEIFFDPKGCAECNHFGYSGRTSAFEVLPIFNGLSVLISQRASASALRDQARREGFVTLREAALTKARRGETSLEEVIRETVE